MLYIEDFHLEIDTEQTEDSLFDEDNIFNFDINEL